MDNKLYDTSLPINGDVNNLNNSVINDNNVTNNKLNSLFIEFFIFR